MLDRTLIDRVYESIKRFNEAEYDPSLPMSDEFMKDFTASEGYSESETKYAITILNEAHRIFVIAVTKENKQRGDKKIDAYVVADQSVISNLRSVYQKRLSEVYRKDKGVNRGIQQIIREVMNNMSSLVNTPVGKLANIAIMLNEYDNLIIRNPEEFSDSWIEEKLEEFLKVKEIPLEEEPAEEEAVAAKGDASGRGRAVDSPEFEDFSAKTRNLTPDKALMIYGADFFFRVKLRRYEFTLLREMIHEGHIKRNSDIVLLRNMIKTIKGNFDRDPRLNEYFEDIFHLDREVSKRLYFSSK